MSILPLIAARRRLLAAEAYAANAVRFDGSTTWLNRGAAFGSDFTAFTLSFWLKMNGSDGAAQRILRTRDGDFWSVQRTTGNAINVSAANSVGSLLVNATSGSTNFTVASGWKHVLLALNPGVTGDWYIDDVGEGGSGSSSAGTIDITRSDFDVGRTTVPSVGQYLDADLADVMLFGSYVDLSSAPNRRKFITADGLPADPAEAVAAFGTPLLLLSGATASWHTNQGSGGGFTENGALGDGTLPVTL